MSNTVVPPTTLLLRSGKELQFFRLLLPVFLAVQLVYAGKVLLIPDEAFYWVLSRHLATGYLDHPPIIAFIIWIGTHLVGPTELGVRLVAVLMSVGAMGIIVALANKVLHDSRATVWVAVIWLTSPLLSALGTLTTPDTPVMFFSVCALAFVALLADRDDRQTGGQPSTTRDAASWLLVGLFSGLAMVSKYTGILLPTAVALAMLFSRQGRAHYRRPWIYLAGLLAVAVFSPVIWWNATHHWASFLFQLHHGTAAHESPEIMSPLAAALRPLRDLGTYIGGQLAVWTPILFVIAVVVLIDYWLRYLVPLLRASRIPPRSFGNAERGEQARPLNEDVNPTPVPFIERQAAKPPLSLVDQILLWSATLPLVLFGLAAIRSHHTEANWPSFAYFPVSLLTARWLSENWTGARVKWAHVGVRVALIGLIGIHVIAFPTVSRKLVQLPVHIPHALQDLNGWHQYGNWLGGTPAHTGALIVTNRHQDAGEAAFYLPGQPEVWCVSIGTRPTSFDYFDDKPDFAKIPQVVWVGGNYDLFEKAYGYIEAARYSAVIVPGRNERSYAAFLLVRPPR